VYTAYAERGVVSKDYLLCIQYKYWHKQIGVFGSLSDSLPIKVHLEKNRNQKKNSTVIDWESDPL
jgi:hypothetical protein